MATATILIILKIMVAIIMKLIKTQMLEITLSDGETEGLACMLLQAL